MARGATKERLRALRKKFGLGEFKKSSRKRNSKPKVRKSRRGSSGKSLVITGLRNPFWGRF